jgi:hypothetical protein
MREIQDHITAMKEKAAKAANTGEDNPVPPKPLTPRQKRAAALIEKRRTKAGNRKRWFVGLWCSQAEEDRIVAAATASGQTIGAYLLSTRTPPAIEVAPPKRHGLLIAKEKKQRAMQIVASICEDLAAREGLAEAWNDLDRDGKSAAIDAWEALVSAKL